jgi:hypothetical protein
MTEFIISPLFQKNSDAGDTHVAPDGSHFFSLFGHVLCRLSTNHNPKAYHVIPANEQLSMASTLPNENLLFRHVTASSSNRKIGRTNGNDCF